MCQTRPQLLLMNRMLTVQERNKEKNQLQYLWFVYWLETIG